MNEIQIFKHEQFGEIHTTLSTDGKILFKAVDVAAALGYKDVTNAIARLCKSGELVYCPHANGFGGTKMKFIIEADVYRLIMRSELPSAEIFQDWVCEEVLPSIRKHGMYATTETIDKILIDPDFGIRLLQELKKEREENARLTKEVEEAKEEVRFCDRMITHLTEKIDINDMRQTLNDIMRLVKGYNFGTAWRHLYRCFEKKYHMNLWARKASTQYPNMLD